MIAVYKIIGHNSCKSNKKCMMHGRQCLVLMCTELPFSQNVYKSPEGTKGQRVANISNQKCSWEVILQSLILKLLWDNGHEQKVAAVIDIGSQLSYLLKQTVTDLWYQSVGSETMTDILLSGANLIVQSHFLYNMKVVFEPLILDQIIICRKIPKLNRGPKKRTKHTALWLWRGMYQHRNVDRSW